MLTPQAAFTMERESVRADKPCPLWRANGDFLHIDSMFTKLGAWLDFSQTKPTQAFWSPG
jgi:hypothetical protein